MVYFINGARDWTCSLGAGFAGSSYATSPLLGRVSRRHG